MEKRIRWGRVITLFFFKQKTAYEIYQCDWSSDVCSSDLMHVRVEKVLSKLPRCHTWVFTARESSKYPSGDHKINGNHLREKLKRILKKLELKGCLHSFRHCFASYCANKGVPPMQLLSWLGHSSLGMVRKYYHLGEDESLRSMREMCQDES